MPSAPATPPPILHGLRGRSDSGTPGSGTSPVYGAGGTYAFEPVYTADEVDDMLAGAGGGDTLPVPDTTAVVKGSADPTKLVRFEADGLTAGTTRALAVPDADGTIVLLERPQTFTSPQTFRAVTVNHVASGQVAVLINGMNYGGAVTDASGLAFVLGYNGAENRQLWLADSSQLGDPTRTAFRYLVGQPVPTIDGVNCTGNQRRHIQLASDTHHVGVGQFDAQADIQAKLHVRAGDPSVRGLVVQGAVGQSANLTEWRDGGGTPQASVGAAGQITVGGGTAVSKILSATATIDFGSIAAAGHADLTLSVSGAADGDSVVVTPVHASVPSNVTFSGWVSSANTVTIRATNNDAVSAADPVSGTFRATLLKF